MKKFLFIGVLASFGNAVFAYVDSNYFAMTGWLVATAWGFCLLSSTTKGAQG